MDESSKAAWGAERSSLERVDNYSLLALSQLVSQKSEDPIIALYGHVQKTQLLRLKFTTVTWVFSHFSIIRYPPYPHYYTRVQGRSLIVLYRHAS